MRKLAFCCGALIWASAAQAGLVTDNFDGIAGEPNSPGALTPVSDRITTFVGVDGGGVTDTATFSTVGGAADVADVQLSPPTPHAPSPPNGIGADTGGDTLFYPGVLTPIQVKFSVATDFVQITGDLLPIPSGGTIFLTAFNSLGVQVASTSQPDTGSGVPLTVSTSTAIIASVQFYSTYPTGALPNTVAFDNLTFNVVPEPTSAVMGLTSMGGLGLVFARRRLGRKSSAA